MAFHNTLLSLNLFLISISFYPIFVYVYNFIFTLISYKGRKPNNAFGLCCTFLLSSTCLIFSSMSSFLVTSCSFWIFSDSRRGGGLLTGLSESASCTIPVKIKPRSEYKLQQTVTGHCVGTMTHWPWCCTLRRWLPLCFEPGWCPGSAAAPGSH